MARPERPGSTALGVIAWLAALAVASICLAPSASFALSDASDEAARAMRVGDYAAAAQALRVGSLAGDAEAQYQLAALYRIGRGVEKSHPEALRWFTAAARQGHAGAQYNTGLFHQHGWGTPVSSERALYWLRLASAQEHRKARERLQDIERERMSAGDRATRTSDRTPAQSDALLLRAVRRRDAAQLTALLQNGHRPPAATTKERSLLHEAVATDAPDIVRILVRAGSPADLADRFGETPLMLAARSGATECLRALAEARVDLDQQDGNGRTALMLAAQHGQTETLRALVTLGARADIRDREGFVAAQLAERAGHRSAARLLPRESADPELESNVRERRVWLETVVSDDASEYVGWPLLNVASLRDDGEVIALLAAEGADLERRDPAGQTALMRAAERNRVGAVRALLLAGADTEATVDDLSALGLASRQGHREVVDLLLDHSGYPSETSPARSALTLALDAGRSAVALRLLEAGAAPERAGPVWLAAVEIAARRAEEDALAMLAQRPGPPLRADELADAACAAGDSGSAETLQWILDLGASGDTRCGDGLPLLAHCGSSESTRACRLLLARGADVEARSASGITPLQHAAHAGRLDIVVLLLDAGADVSARGRQRTTALMAASQAGHREVVERLLERGAQSGDRNARGQTASQLAELAGHSDVVRTIQDHAAGSGWFGSR